MEQKEEKPKENWVIENLSNVIWSIATLGVAISMTANVLGDLTKQLEKEAISRLKKLRRKGKCVVEFRNISSGYYYGENVYKNEEIKISEIKEYLKQQKKQLGSYWSYREEDLKGVLKYHMELKHPKPQEIEEFDEWKKEKNFPEDIEREKWWYNKFKKLSKLGKKKVEKFYFCGSCPHCGYEPYYIDEYFKLKKELGYKCWKKLF